MGKIAADLSSVVVVGLDLAKHVFQVHAIDRDGRVIVARALRRKEVLEFFLRPSRALSRRIGSLWFGPLLGARAGQTWP